jgi:hypothetical protein
LNETYSKVRVGKHFFDSFPIQNCLKQGDALSTLLFNFALEYAIRKFQENQLGLKLNRTHQLLSYADDVNLLGDTIDTMKKNIETLIDTSKEVGLELNIENVKYMLVSRLQNAGQNQDIKIENRSFENVSQFKYLRNTVTNQNLIQEKLRGGYDLFFFPPSIVNTYKNQNTQYYNFACVSVCLQNLVSGIKSAT